MSDWCKCKHHRNQHPPVVVYTPCTGNLYPPKTVGTFNERCDCEGFDDDGDEGYR